MNYERNEERIIAWKTRMLIMKIPQIKLAKELGISESYLSDLLSGRRNTPSLIEHIERVLKIHDKE